jgi:hypothetical protein
MIIARDVSHPDQGSLIAQSEVPTNIATWYNTPRHSRHRADNSYLAGGNGSETQIKPFYEFERRKELDGGAIGRGAFE